MIWFIMSFLLVLGISLYFSIIKGFNIECTCCKDNDIDCFSKLENGELKDYHKCNNCGHIELVNSEPYPHNI